MNDTLISELEWLLTTTRYHEWLMNDVFHLKWWLLLSMFIISIYVWCKLVDKARVVEVTLCLVLVAILALVLDELGEELCFWDYPVDLIPLFPPLTAINLASLPVVYSLIYQYSGTLRHFLKNITIMSAIFSFIFEPVMVWGGLYQVLTWKYYYSFPLYILLALAVRALVTAIYKVSNRALQTSSQ